MLFAINLILYLAIFLPLTCVLGLIEGAVRAMWGVNPAELRYQAGAWAVFEAPGLLLVAVPVVLLLGWLAMFALWVSMLVLWVMGLIAALNGQMKPMPVVGEYYQKWFGNTFE